MKRKNSDSRVHRWLLRTGMAFLLILALVSVVLLSFNLGMLHHGSVNSGPSGAVLDDNSPFVHAPAHTVLRQVQRADLAGTLFLAGWIEPKGTKCLGAMRVKQNHRLDNGHAFHGSITECDLDRYSIDQFWTGKLWDREPYSFAYGYSGDAESVVVTWQDNTVTQDTPVNSTYIAIREARWLAIRSIDFTTSTARLSIDFLTPGGAVPYRGRTGRNLKPPLVKRLRRVLLATVLFTDLSVALFRRGYVHLGHVK